MSKTIRKLVFLATAVVSFGVFLSPVNAAELYTRDDLLIDQGLSDQSQNSYGYYDAVVVSSITIEDSVSFGRGDEWMKGLYYYMITKLNFLDVPFNHIVTWQGDVFEGKGGGMEVSSLATFNLNKDYANPYLVVYFDNGRGMTNQGKDGLSEFMTDLASQYSIPLEDVISADMTFSIAQEGELSSLAVSPVDSGYIADWMADWKEGFEESNGLGLEMTGSIGDITLPEEIGAGQLFTIQIEFENTGEVPWYNSGTHTTFIGTSDPRDRNSGLYMADNWASFARVVAPTEELVLPGETATFEFSSRAPVIPGSYAESFELIRLGDGWLSNTQFELEFTVVQGDLDVVEILDTETGFLNVRSCAGLSCEEIGTVEPGYRTVVTDRSGSWIKIIYDGSNEGWVYGKYVKEL